MSFAHQAALVLLALSAVCLWLSWLMDKPSRNVRRRNRRLAKLKRQVLYTRIEPAAIVRPRIN